MTVFIDASALVAIIRDEPEASTLKAALNTHPTRLTNGVALWEAAMAVSRAAKSAVEAGWMEVERYRAALDIVVVPIGEDESAAAFQAHISYGKGRHAARLNMGDCFSYACAKTNGAKLLYKGGDFVHTDLADA